MEAGIGGVLELRGRCLGLDMGEAGFRTIVWHSDARLGSDGEGLFVEANGGRFRLGERLSGGGGTMPDDFQDARLRTPYPEECGRDRAVEFGGVQRMEENPPIRVQPPPPPPAQ